MFISSIDVFFQSKDDSVPVTIDIRTIENGFPTETILPNSTKTIEASTVTTSTNASVLQDSLLIHLYLLRKVTTMHLFLEQDL